MGSTAGVPALFGGCGLGFRGRLAGGGGLHLPGREHRKSAQRNERNLRHAGNQSEGHQNSADDPQRARRFEHLLADVRAERVVRGRAGHNNAARNGYQQRRDDRDQAVADGQDGVGLERFLKRHPLLKDSDQEAGNDVDDHDEDGGQRISLAEAGGAVHRSAELRFPGNRLAACASLVGVDQAGIQIGVDRHLLAGHGIEGEARRYFGGTNRAVADDQILNRDECDEDDKTDDVVAANHKLPERLDHLAAAEVPSLPCSRIRRVLARSSESRIRVSRRIRLGNTENCVGRRIWIAVSRTSTDAVMLSVSSRSRMMLGNGTSITNTSATAAVGMIQSPDARSVASSPGFLVTGVSSLLEGWRRLCFERRVS